MSYRHVPAQERIAIFYLQQMGLSFRAIGKRLGVPPHDHYAGVQA